jgi:hypothetical protein
MPLRQYTQLPANQRQYTLLRANFHFGPGNVAAWSVAIGVELERGPDVAERIAPEVPRLTAVLSSADRRSGLHFDIARGMGTIRRRP